MVVDIRAMLAAQSGLPALPEHPLLLAPVAIPFKGDLEGVQVLYDVHALRELADTAFGQEISADLQAERATILAKGRALTDADMARLDENYLEEALRIIQYAVHAVEWGYAAPPPAPADPLSFAILDERVLLWLAGEGVEEAAREWTGPLSLAAIKRASSRIMARPPL